MSNLPIESGASNTSETVYFISGGKVKIHVGDQIVDAEIPDGHVMHHGPWTHSVENVGDKAVEAIIFELVPVMPMEDHDHDHGHDHDDGDGDHDG